MNTENNSQNNLNTPTEEYTFTYTVEELKKIYKQLNRLNSRQPIFILSVLVITLLIYNLMNPEGFIKGLCNGTLIGMGIMYFTMFFKGLSITSKARKKSLEKATSNVYNYKIFQDYLVLTIHRDNEKTLEQKVNFRDIEKFFNVSEYILFQFQNRLYILKKDLLQADSYFLHFSK